jgi:hypothetical protein
MPGWVPPREKTIPSPSGEACSTRQRTSRDGDGRPVGLVVLGVGDLGESASVGVDCVDAFADRVLGGTSGRGAVISDEDDLLAVRRPARE